MLDAALYRFSRLLWACSVRPAYVEEGQRGYSGWLPPTDALLFGSAPLVLYGIRAEPIGDVDVMVSRTLWGRLLALRDDMGIYDANVLTPRADDPPLLEIQGSTDGSLNIHVFYDWTARDESWISPADMRHDPELVDWEMAGWRWPWVCVGLDEIVRHKRGAHAANPDSPIHEKHLADADEIDALLRTTFTVPIEGSGGVSQRWPL